MVLGVPSGKIWKTCCALHNWLLDIDGLEEHWENGVPSVWEGELGNHAASDICQFAAFAIQRLHSPLPVKDMTFLAMVMALMLLKDTGWDDDNDHNDDNDDSTMNDGATVDGVQIVRDLSLKFFCGCLIEHVDILFERHQIQWPSH